MKKMAFKIKKKYITNLIIPVCPTGPAKELHDQTTAYES